MATATLKTSTLRRPSLKGILDGTFLTKEIVLKQLPYILFLTAMAVIYIGNSYHAEKMMLDGIKLEKQIRDMRSESITLQSELMYLRRQSEVARLMDEHQMTLKKPTKPAYRIEVAKK